MPRSDGSGSIDISELGSVLRRMQIVSTQMPGAAVDEFVRTQMQLADTDRSGQLSFAEFVDYYNAVCDLPQIAQAAREAAEKATAAAAAKAARAARRAAEKQAKLDADRGFKTAADELRAKAPKNR